MIGRKALTGLSLLCALVFCAFAAPSAFAATSGTTAVTCVEGATKDFSDAHCDKQVAAGTGKYGHRATTGNPTTFTGTNESTANETKEAQDATLTTTAGGLETELTCKEVHSEGTLENELVEENHRITGSGVVIVYKKCEAKKPAGQECKVTEPITTESLKFESVAGPPMGLKFVPTTGTTFANVTLSGCKTAGLNKSYAVTGSVTTKPSGGSENYSGSTVIVELPKAGSTLEFGGQKAGLTQVETIRMKEGEPLATTAPPFEVK